MNPIFALWNGPVAQWSLIDIIITLVILAAVIGIALVAVRQMGITIPSWVMTIFWICVVAFVAIFAIRLVAGM